MTKDRPPAFSTLQKKKQRRKRKGSLFFLNPGALGTHAKNALDGRLSPKARLSSDPGYYKLGAKQVPLRSIEAPR